MKLNTLAISMAATLFCGSVYADASGQNTTNSGADWTGFYAGGHVGYLSGYENRTPIGIGTLEGDDGYLGLHAGYQHDFGQFVLGGEVEYDFTGFAPTSSASGVTTAFRVGDTVRIKARLGYDADMILPYAVVGYSWQDLTTPTGRQDTYKDAAYGVGLAYQMNDQVLLGAEILGHDLDADIGTRTSEFITVTLRASYRF